MTSFTSQRLDRSEIRHNLDQFKHHWRSRLNSWKAADEGAIEKKYAQSFWADFLDCFGISAARMDLFEQDAKRGSTGNTGYIDLFWPGVVIGEAKKPGVDLQIAVDQARDYLQGGSVSDVEQPRYILASDFEHFRLLRLGDPEQRFDVLFPLAEVTDHLDQLRFLAGHDDSMTRREEEVASLKASKIMAALFTAMAGDVDEEVSDAAPTNPEDEDEDVQRTSIFLTRLLFLLFGDDAGLWESDTFYRFVLENTTSENLGSQLDALFDVLNTPEHRRRRVPESMASFPYVNGALFDRAGEMRTTTFFSPDMRNALLDACRFRWTDISPAIFGSLFQLVKSKEARRGDGEHYTSEKNILKTIEPLFLDELREQAAKLIARTTGSTKKQLEDLRAFRDSLATNLYIDGACGSGNFLIVAYRELRKIETAIIVAIREREGSASMALDITWEQKLSIGQFHGIEINWWPAKIAETAMFLVDHQANRELADQVGLAPERLPIAITAHIHHGNALQMDWPTLFPKVSGQTYVFGNPPFIGQKEKTASQTADMKRVWGGNYDGYLDYVTGWHAQALALLDGRPGSFAFVTTNSISQGQPVPALFDPIFSSGWRIRFAHRTFPWDSEAPGKAAVHCVIVGFDKKIEPRPRLWDYPQNKGEAVEIPVERAINAYLVDGPNILISKRSDSKKVSPELPVVVSGSTAYDWNLYTFTEETVQLVKQDPIAQKYLRPYVGGEELINDTERWCLWLKDVSPTDVAKSALLKDRIDEVKRRREGSGRAGTRNAARTPHLFGEDRQPEEEYLGIPQTFAEGRLYFTAKKLQPHVIANKKLFTAKDSDGFLFALISSSMFMTWQKTVGGRLKSDPSFSNTIVWNNLPLPTLEDSTKGKIIKAGHKIVETRAQYPNQSLADLYAPRTMSPDLIKAHDVLDREVDKAFGAPRKLTTERQRQELLFANYVRLTGGNV